MTSAPLARPATHLGRYPAAVLFDRDGTLVEDVPYNGDPGLVRPVTGAREALERVRRKGIPIGVVSNQSGVGRGLIDRDEVDRVNARVEQMLGPVQTWRCCFHVEADRCACRKPKPGLVLLAAAALGVDVTEVVVIGDIGSDVEAAEAAGAVGILVPTPQTDPRETDRARLVAPHLAAAVDIALGVTRPGWSAVRHAGR